MVLSTLDSLTPEERHDFYKTLGLKAIANGDGSLEATAAFGEELSFCEAETERPYPTPHQSGQLELASPQELRGPDQAPYRSPRYPQ